MPAVRLDDEQFRSRGRRDEARQAYAAALALARLAPERRFLAARLAEVS